MTVVVVVSTKRQQNTSRITARKDQKRKKSNQVFCSPSTIARMSHLNLPGMVMSNHHLQGMVLKPRANSVDPRIAKTGELKRSKGEDGKHYMMLDKKDWNRYHVLSDQEVEEEYRRSIEIEKAVIKSTGRIRPHSASSAGRYHSHNSPLRPHSANDSSHSHINQPQIQYIRDADHTRGISPNRSSHSIHHPLQQQDRGIAMADNNNNHHYNYTHPQQTHHNHRHSADNLSHTNAATIASSSSLQPASTTRMAYEPPPQYRYTSPNNQGHQRQVQQTHQQQQHHDLYDNHDNHNNTHSNSSSSPVILTMGALRAKYEQNLDVIEQLYREKRSLEDRVRSLDYQVLGVVLVE